MTRLPGGPPERLARAGVTEREAEVLSAVAQRLHNREIADRLYISVRTVESHISALLASSTSPTGRPWSRWARSSAGRRSPGPPCPSP
jgi:FixJ family two-component response regulator